MRLNDFTVKRITRLDQKALGGLNNLLLGWSKKGHKMSPGYFKKVIKKSHVLGLYHKDKIIGTVTLIETNKLSGLKGSVEHLMIDEKYRGRGLGKKLMKHTIFYAKNLKIEALFLTCEPKRKAANSLYQKLGFRIKDTNFYFKKL